MPPASRYPGKEASRDGRISDRVDALHNSADKLHGPVRIDPQSTKGETACTSRQRMAKGVQPTHFLIPILHATGRILPPIWMASAMMLTGDHPVIGFTISATRSPLSECLGEDWDWHGLLRRFRLASTDDAIGDRTPQIHCALRKSEIAHLSANNLLWPNPVSLGLALHWTKSC